MESIVWMTSTAFVTWKPLENENIIDDENIMFFLLVQNNNLSCEGDEAAIPTGGVKPTFTERPVSSLPFCFTSLTIDDIY